MGSSRGKGVAAVAAPGFNLVLLADGSVLSWGANDEGQLGLGPLGVLPRAGTAMPPVPVPTPSRTLSGVRQLAALDPNRMTPMDALQHVSAWIEALRGE